MDAASQNGTYNREQFIKEHLSFIRNITATHTGKMLEWGRDEELSIALIAFNSAIDAFEYQKSANFKAFAALIIKRRLIDYYRSGSQRRNREFPSGDIGIMADYLEAPIGNLERLLAQEREWEIRAFIQEIKAFGIELTDLVEQAPQKKSLREHLHSVAGKIAGEPDLHKQILVSGRLPLKHLSNMTGLNEATLSKRRKYLLAILYILANISEYPFISTYLNLEGGSQE